MFLDILSSLLLNIECFMCIQEIFNGPLGLYLILGYYLRQHRAPDKPVYFGVWTGVVAAFFSSPDAPTTLAKKSPQFTENDLIATFSASPVRPLK